MLAKRGMPCLLLWNAIIFFPETIAMFQFVKHLQNNRNTGQAKNIENMINLEPWEKINK